MKVRKALTAVAATAMVLCAGVVVGTLVASPAQAEAAWWCNDMKFKSNFPAPASCIEEDNFCCIEAGGGGAMGAECGSELCVPDP